MKINIGIVILSFAVCVYLVANYLHFSSLFAWLLAGIGASRLGDYWEIKSKSEDLRTKK